MKVLICISIFLFYSSVPAAEKKENIKEDLSIRQDILTKYSLAKIEEKFLPVKEKMHMLMKEISYSRTLPVLPQQEAKISTGIFYIAGAAALAVLVYFLWPDDPPETTPGNTFGLPVTPK